VHLFLKSWLFELSYATNSLKGKLCIVSRPSKYLSIIDFSLMLVESSDISFNFLFNLRTNARSNEGDVLKNENDLEAW